MFILMAIKPKFAQLILQGKKTVEIRRTNIKATKGDKVAIYASSPRKQIVGFFTIEDIQYENIDRIWSEFGEYACLSSYEYKDYLVGKDKACAIKISEIEKIEGCSLEEISSKLSIRIPQSYRYISENTFRTLCRLENDQ